MTEREDMPAALSDTPAFTARNTVEVDAPGTPTAERLCVVIVGDDHFATHPLPAFGPVSIGRASTNDIAVSSAMMSRNHAVLHVGAEMAIEDLGSVNGTKVGGQQLNAGEKRAFEIGSVLEVGTIMMIVQRSASAPRARRIWSHDTFEARLESECARAAQSGGNFSVMRVHVSPDGAETAQAVLHEVSRPADLVGLYAPGEYEVLLVDTTTVRAKAISRRIGALLSAAGGRVGLASFPTDGRSADELLGRASGNARKRSGETSEQRVIVEDGAMQQLYQIIDRVAQGTISVLLLGETGVGKEVTAEAVHRMSPRSDKPFLRLNCAALSESLLESELFGHTKGSFTGATAEKQGLLESANGGTVFLDEIGELPMQIQVKLLRVLEERRVRRVGALDSRPIDVRFVAATNRVLEDEIERGHFREDLYYRLAGVSLRIPPLRERLADIDLLVRSFTTRAAESLGRQRPLISDEAFALLREYSWPGNVRELRNVIERAVLLAADGAIEAEHLPLEKMRATVRAPARPMASPLAGLSAEVPSHFQVGAPAPMIAAPAPDAPHDPKRERLLRALQETAGNQTRAAEVLGISRRTMVNWLNKYGIARPRKRDEPL